MFVKNEAKELLSKLLTTQLLRHSTGEIVQTKENRRLFGNPNNLKNENASSTRLCCFVSVCASPD